MAVPTQLQNRIADDLSLLVIDRIRAYAHRRSVAFKQKAAATTDVKVQAALTAQAAEFERLSQTFGSLADPDQIPYQP